jgi:NTP pyrophosphatase (non-canonical NTP hydrolase)
MTGMTLAEYQRGALRTAAYPDGARVLYPALKLAGEAGEVTEKLGKLMRDEGWVPGAALSAAQRDALGQELGDVLWYVAVLARDLELDLDAVASANLAKLASRRERGVIGGSGDDR